MQNDNMSTNEKALLDGNNANIEAIFCLFKALEKKGILNKKDYQDELKIMISAPKHSAIDTAPILKDIHDMLE